MSTPTNPQPTPNASTQIRVQAQRRQQGPASLIYTPDLIPVVDRGGSPPAPFSIVMTGSNGLIDPSLLPTITTVLLETNGVANTVQNVLNLKSGTNIVLTADAFGGVTITASGSFSTNFGNITTGDNTSATMTVDTGASLAYAGSGVVNANEIGTINVSGNTPSHAGQLLISQPGNTTAVWADPMVQGLYPDGTPVSTPIFPVYVGGKGTDGLLHGVLTTPTGAVVVVNADEQEATVLLTFSANTGAVQTMVTTSQPVLSIQAEPSSPPTVTLVRKLRLSSNGATVFWQLILNGTLTGALFQSVDPASHVDFDTAATSISGGRVVDSGYLSLGAEEEDYTLPMSSHDTYTLVVTNMGKRVIPVSASFRWTEEAASL